MIEPKLLRCDHCSHTIVNPLLHYANKLRQQWALLLEASTFIDICDSSSLILLKYAYKSSFQVSRFVDYNANVA